MASPVTKPIDSSTTLIEDASIGHCLTSSVLERFTQPWERFIEATA